MERKVSNSFNKSLPRAALVCGIVGLICASAGSTLFGWILGAVGGFLGIIAIFLGIASRRQTGKTRGTGGLVLGWIAVGFAVTTVTLLYYFSITFGNMAADRGFPMIEKHAKALFGSGVVGMMMEAKSDSGDTEEMLRELDEMNQAYRDSKRSK